MSPTKTTYKEDLLVVADLDTANTTKESEISVNLVLPKSLPTFRLADKSAIEHEESTIKLPISEGLSEKEDAECCQKQLEDNTETSKNNVLSTSLNDLQNSNHTPSCLNTNELEHSSNDSLTCPKSFVGCSDANEAGASLEDVKQKFSQRKRKKKTKYNWKKSSKKRRTTYFGQNVCRKVAGGGKQTNQTCSTGNGTDGATPAAAKPSTAGGAAGNHGCQGGGGGGDGGEDGDGPRNNKKQFVHNVPFKRNRKKKTSSDEMEVDGDVVSSSDSPMMDVEPKSSEKQGGDAHMVDANPHGARPEEKPPRTDEKSSKVGKPMTHQNLLIEYHRRINHFASVCKKINCDRCPCVRHLLCFHLKERENGCACKQCNLRFEILQYHRKICNSSWCGICAELKLAPNVFNVQKGLGVKNVGQNVQNVRQNVQNVRNVQHAQPVVLNAPLSASSLDTINEAVIYKDDCLEELGFFREHEDFTFKATEMVGNGANGEVYEVSLDPEFKNRHLPSAKDNFVVKKAVVNEDEVKVLKHISNHPNFVKTYLVANRVDGKFKQVILMEKCDKSLRDYMKTKQKGPKGEILDHFEAMHYWTQVLDAVVYLHHNLKIPVIHKDIKSANVLLTYESNLVRAKLADFDAIKLLYDEYTQPGLVPKGTKYFVAPEVAQWRVHGRPADIYSMGIFLLELLFGSLVKTPEVPLRLLRDIDCDLAELVARCLKVDPQERPTAIEIQNNRAVKKYMKKDAVP